MGKLYYRKLDCTRSLAFFQTISDIHEKVHNKPYDTNAIDWFKAALKLYFGDERKTNTYWCSALIAYHRLGFTSTDTKWTVVSPKDFSQEEDPLNLKFVISLLC